MKTVSYNDARKEIRNGDLLLFAGKSLWPSWAIRWCTNGIRWWKPWGWLPWKLAPWSHAELAFYDVGTGTLCGWGSVGGGPRLVPLSRLLFMYGHFGWAPYIGELFREEIIIEALKRWRVRDVDYPHGITQYLRTLFRNPADVHPSHYTCWEWVAACHAMRDPTLVRPSDFLASGKFGELVKVV